MSEPFKGQPEKQATYWKERYEIIKDEHSKLAAEIAELKARCETLRELADQSAGDAGAANHRLMQVQKERDTLRAELEAVKGRAQDVSQEEVNELQAILRTLAPSGRALVHSARQLVDLWEKQTSELEAVKMDLETAQTSADNYWRELEAVRKERERDSAKLSERKTVHEWLNALNIPSEEDGKSLCLLRRLRITCDLFAELKSQPSADDVILIRCTKHLNIGQQNANEHNGGECGGCIAAQRDTALAAKDAAEKERDAWERSSIAWQENHAKALERVDALWEELTAQRRLENWVIQLRGRGYIKAADSLIVGFLSDIDKARALTPAPTQEPPAGGVTISNDSSSTEGSAEHVANRCGVTMPVSGSSGNQAPPAVPPSTSPADVPSVGRGELLPFNLSDALAGKPVVTRDGRKASKIQGDKLLGGTVNGIYYNWYRDGKCTNGNPLHDLFMLPTEGSGA